MGKIRICITIEEDEEPMSTVEVVATGTIRAAVQPLTISQTSDSLPDMQVGVVLPPTPIATVSNGVPPYSYSFDQDTDGSKGLVQKSPDDLSALGLVINEDQGNISIAGTPTQEATIAFGLIATDQEGMQANATLVGKKKN